MLDLLATGYPSIDHIVPVSRIPPAGQTALIDALPDSVPVHYGGCGANVAVGLRRLGFQTGLAMVLGDDDAGGRYRDYLTGEGVDCRDLLMLPDTGTSSSYLFRSPDGEMINFFYPGAADAWRGELALQAAGDSRWGLVTVGYLPYNRAFVAALSAANVPIIWQMKADVAAYPSDVLHQFVAASRMIFCNRLEADYLVQGLGLSTLREVFTYGVEQIVMTLGGDGSQVLTPDDEVHVPTVPAAVVDTTGAGDGYSAGFLAGCWRGYDPLTCGRLGATAAAFVIEVVGCQTALPGWERLQSRFEENFGAL
ncbi:MAG: hypothetical protein IPK19_06310 [Chloroflexi bacterium]|nr:hypothetical protein [Chloroflexota bacterium]